MAKKFLTWLLLFIAVLFVVQGFQPKTDVNNEKISDITLEPKKDSFVLGDPVVLSIQNNTDQELSLPTDCPEEPFRVERYSNGVWTEKHSPVGLYISCKGGNFSSDFVYTDIDPFFVISPSQSITVDYSPWKDDLFSDLGTYRVLVDVNIDGIDKTFSTEFQIRERGFLSSVSFHLFYRPIFNFLLFLTTIFPGHNFGYAVIALTVLIRLLLLIPNQKALKSQRSMMKIQPELEAIKKKYKGNQEKISKETIALWKKHRVSPVGGCLPMLIQLPILISLFYVVRSGFSPYQGNLLYTFFDTLDLTRISTNFFSFLDLQLVNKTWLPLLVGLLQFYQLRLSFSRRLKKKSHGKEIVDIGEKKKSPSTDPMQMMSKSMMYFMPVVIALTVATVPSAVGLYFIISTLFGIGQQYAVNRSVA